jgi:hypothetical protein
VNPVRGWNAFWFGPISARPLAAFRIAFGLLVLAHLVVVAGDAGTWLTNAGYLRGDEPREIAGPWRLSPLQWFHEPATVYAFLAATAVVTALFVGGWRTRLMAVLMYLGLLSIYQRMFLALSGADGVMICMAFYLMFSPSGAAYSLDARRVARAWGGPAEPLIVPWAQRLMQIQLSIVYFMTAFWKATGKTWSNGTAIYYALGNTEFRRWTFGLMDWPVALHALTAGVLFFEFALAFLLWFRPTRPFAICGGIALHAGILLTINIPIFGELMVASYLTFLTPAELDAILRAADVRRWFKGIRAGRSAAASGRIDRPESAIRGPHAGRPLLNADDARTRSAAAMAMSDSADALASPVGR